MTTSDPPLTVSGMTLVDARHARTASVEFQAVPPQFDAERAPAAPPRWEPLFDAAGLAMASFTPVTPQWSPRDFADTRAAWEGPLPDRPEYRVRVEAAAYRGRPVSMFVARPMVAADADGAAAAVDGASGAQRRSSRSSSSRS